MPTPDDQSRLQWHIEQAAWHAARAAELDPPPAPVLGSLLPARPPAPVDPYALPAAFFTGRTPRRPRRSPIAWTNPFGGAD